MIQISIAHSEETEKELASMGFEKQEVWIKHSVTSKEKGDIEFFDMARRPFQFCTTSFWGMGNE